MRFVRGWRRMSHCVRESDCTCTVSVHTPCLRRSPIRPYLMIQWHCQHNYMLARCWNVLHRSAVCPCKSSVMQSFKFPGHEVIAQETCFISVHPAQFHRIFLCTFGILSICVLFMHLNRVSSSVTA